MISVEVLEEGHAFHPVIILVFKGGIQRPKSHREHTLPPVPHGGLHIKPTRSQVLDCKLEHLELFG